MPGEPRCDARRGRSPAARDVGARRSDVRALRRGTPQAHAARAEPRARALHALPRPAATATRGDRGRSRARRPSRAARVDGGRIALARTRRRVREPDLLVVRRSLAAAWSDDLIAQDRESYRPHVVVHNKTSPAEARRAFEELQDAFGPFDATGDALELWRYDGGPWTKLARFAFAADQAAAAASNASSSVQ